jgi:sugar lactone lactonase YvrE
MNRSSLVFTPSRFTGGVLTVRQFAVVVSLSVIAACLCTTPTQAEILFVSESGTAIVSYDVSLASGALVAASRTTFATSDNTYQDFRGLAFDQAGNLYAAKPGKIEKFDSSGTLVSTISAPDPNDNLMGLAFDSSGNLYAAAYQINAVLKFDSSGALVSTITSNMSAPLGIAFDSQGNLYVVNDGNNAVDKYDSAGTYLGVFGYDYGNPYGIAFDSAGNGYVSNAQNPGSVVKFDSSGAILSRITSNMHYPTGVAVDSLDNVYVHNAGGGKISKYDPTGAFLFEWSAPAAGMFFAFEPVAVPEPSTYAMAVAGLACGGYLVRRRRKRA